MKIRTIALALVATGFTATAAMAQGTMQPIPNPPEKAPATKHHPAHTKAKKAAAQPATAAAPKK